MNIQRQCFTVAKLITILTLEEIEKTLMKYADEIIIKSKSEGRIKVGFVWISNFIHIHFVLYVWGCFILLWYNIVCAFCIKASAIKLGHLSNFSFFYRENKHILQSGSFHVILFTYTFFALTKQCNLKMVSFEVQKMSVKITSFNIFVHVFVCKIFCRTHNLWWKYINSKVKAPQMLNKLAPTAVLK